MARVPYMVTPTRRGFLRQARSAGWSGVGGFRLSLVERRELTGLRDVFSAVAVFSIFCELSAPINFNCMIDRIMVNC